MFNALILIENLCGNRKYMLRLQIICKIKSLPRKGNGKLAILSSDHKTKTEVCYINIMHLHIRSCTKTQHYIKFEYSQLDSYLWYKVTQLQNYTMF